MRIHLLQIPILRGVRSETKVTLSAKDRMGRVAEKSLRGHLRDMGGDTAGDKAMLLHPREKDLKIHKLKKETERSK